MVIFGQTFDPVLCLGAAGLAGFGLGALTTWLATRARRSPGGTEADEVREAPVGPKARVTPLVGWREFYRGQLARGRLKGEYVSLRREKSDKEERSRDVLKELRDAQRTSSDIVALCGGSGYGKSRLLVELCRGDSELLFANTHACARDLPALMSALSGALSPGRWFIVDDLEKHPGLGRLLGDLLARTKARLLVACRDPGEVDALDRDQTFKTTVVRLGAMLNVADVVKAGGRDADRIQAISRGVPALAELAGRYRDLSGISDERGLLSSITDDMAAGFGGNGRAVLAEVSLRGGTAADEEPIKSSHGAMLKVRDMGYVVDVPVQGRTLQRLDPDILAEFVCREVYFHGGAPAPAVSVVLRHMPMGDFRPALAMLIALYRGQRVAGAAEAGRMLFEELMSRPQMKKELEKPAADPDSGAPEPQPASGPLTAVLVDMVLTAADGFQRADVAGHLLESVWQAALGLSEPELLAGLGRTFHGAGMAEPAEKCLSRAESLFRDRNDPRGRAAVLDSIGLIWQDRGEPARALKYHEEALAINRKFGRTRGEATSLGNMAMVHRTEGRLDEALRCHQRALATHRQTGDGQGAANQLGNIGAIYRTRGEPDVALKYLAQALVVSGSADAGPQVGRTLRNLVPLLRTLGRDKFNAGCVEAGMSRADAEKLAGELEKMPEPLEEEKA